MSTFNVDQVPWHDVEGHLQQCRIRPNCNRCVYLFGPPKGIKWAEYLHDGSISPQTAILYLVLYPHTMSNSVCFLLTWMIHVHGLLSLIGCLLDFFGQPVSSVCFLLTWMIHAH
ncbi:hypothetical protein EV363DRAFT_1351663, partial [Boletus edulis]